MTPPAPAGCGHDRDSVVAVPADWSGSLGARRPHRKCAPVLSNRPEGQQCVSPYPGLLHLLFRYRYCPAAAAPWRAITGNTCRCFAHSLCLSRREAISNFGTDTVVHSCSQGGGGVNTPLRFFEDSEKTASFRAAVFYMPYQPSISHLF